MSTSFLNSGERVRGVHVTEDTLAVDLADGRTIIVPLTWYPRLLNATAAQRSHWKVSGSGYGIHWPEIDEDLSTEGLRRTRRLRTGACSLLASVPNSRAVRGKNIEQESS